MKKIKTNKVTVYLLKDSISSEEDFLVNPPSVESKELSVGCKIYFRRTNTITPKWITGFFDEQLDDIKTKLLTSSSGALLIKTIVVGEKEYKFALTFGQLGFHMLKTDTVVVGNFGLITTLNSLDQNTLRSIDSSNMGASPKNMRLQTIKQSEMIDFGINFTEDIVKTVAAKCKDSDFGTTIDGKDSLHISSKTNILNLDNLLEKIVVNYISDEYKKRFPNINNVQEVRDKTIVSKLDSLLVEQIKKSNNSTTYLALPEIIDWNAISKFCFSIDKRQKFDDIEIADIRNIWNEKGIIPALSDLKNTSAVALDDEGKSIDNWTIYQCLYAEVDFEGTRYILTDSKFYQVKDSFAQEIQEDFTRILDTSISLPKYETGDHEDIYNEKFSNSAENLMLMDKKKIPTGEGTNTVEFCDVFDKDNKTLYHVKRFEGSSPLSHLFNQGLVSAEWFIGDSRFREKVNEKLGYDEFSPIANEPNRAEYTIIYAVISKSANNLDIPLFAKVALRNIVRTLTNYGFGSVKLTKIEHMAGE